MRLLRALRLRTAIAAATLAMMVGYMPGRSAAAAGMAAVGTLVVTSSTSITAGITTYTLAWTSSAGGAVSGNPFTVKRGYLVGAKIVPSAITAPTALYDITLIDTDTVDVLNGLAADQSATLGRYFLFDPPLYYDGTQQLDLVVANAGNAKLGTVILWVRTQ